MRIKIFLNTAIILSILFCNHTLYAAHRIVSLKPNITEIIFDLGVGDEVVGVTKYCDYPNQAKALPKVADYTRPFLEPIIALQPDMVIGSKEESSKKAIDNLKQLGINTYLFSFSTLNEIFSSIIGISQTIGREKQGQEIVDSMHVKLRELKVKWEKVDKKRILIVLDRKPLVVVGKNTYLDDLLSYISAQNVVSSASVKYPRWSIERVIAEDPDVIIDLSMNNEVSSNSKAFWSKLVTVFAIKENKVFLFDMNQLRPSPRVIKGMQELGEMIHQNRSL